MSEKKRLFVDMDGTLAEFKVVDSYERLYEQHYYERLRPNENVVEAVRNIILEHPEIEVYILSSVLADSKYSLSEKQDWLRKYLPECPEENWIFPPCGSCKKDHVPNGIGSDDYLLDDYSLKLSFWDPPAKGIKLLNGINGNNGTWDKISSERNGSSVSSFNKSEILAEKICRIINDNVQIFDIRPQELNKLYDDFLAQVPSAEMPKDLNDHQSRAAVREYINTLCKGRNITDGMQEIIEKLQQSLMSMDEVF